MNHSSNFMQLRRLESMPKTLTAEQAARLTVDDFDQMPFNDRARLARDHRGHYDRLYDQWRADLPWNRR